CAPVPSNKRTLRSDVASEFMRNLLSIEYRIDSIDCANVCLNTSRRHLMGDRFLGVATSKGMVPFVTTSSVHPDRSPSAGPPKSKGRYVLDRLREEIAEGVLSPGTALKQTDIAQRYGVSATPVREALRLLESEGQVAYVANRGAVVHDSASRI